MIGIESIPSRYHIDPDAHIVTFSLSNLSSSQSAFSFRASATTPEDLIREASLLLAQAQQSISTDDSNKKKKEVGTPKLAPLHEESHAILLKLVKSSEIEHDVREAVEALLERLKVCEGEREEAVTKLNRFKRVVASQVDQRVESLRNDVTEQMNLQLSDLSRDLTRICNEVTTDPEEAERERNAGKKVSKTSKGVVLRRKVFEWQDSLLTEMLRTQNYSTILNLAVSILIMWAINLIIQDVSSMGTMDYSLVSSSFRNIGVVFGQHWLSFIAASLLILPIAHLVAPFQPTTTVLSSADGGDSKLGKKRRKGDRHTVYNTAPVRYCGVLCYIALQCWLFYRSGAIVRTLRLAPPLAITLMAEQARFSMKIHSYFREKICSQRTGHVGYASTTPWPLTGHYVYSEFASFFLFFWAPTLVYRFKYPRRRRIRWSFCLQTLAEMFGAIYYAYLIFRTTLPPIKALYTDVNQRDLVGDPVIFIVSIFRCMGPAMVLMFLAHFLVLHSTQNLFGELTRFADRKFYQDWWNVTTWSGFYRKWNGVVHDFIHCYLYTDLVEFGQLPRGTALMLAFVISAVIHEYIIAVSMGYFFPVLLFLFGGPGIWFMSLTRGAKGRPWNIFMWLMLFTGQGLMMVLYAREYYSRLVWEKEPLHTFESLVPQSFTLAQLLSTENYHLVDELASTLNNYSDGALSKILRFSRVQSS